MRTKLLLTAALAATLAWGAAADVKNVPVPEKPLLDIDPRKAEPPAPEFDKSPADIDGLFEPDGDRFRQQGRISQEGNLNLADIDQDSAQEGLALINQEGNLNEANIEQIDEEDNVSPGPGITFNDATGIAIVGQRGDGNTATVLQDIRLTAGPSNLVDIHQNSDEVGVTDVNFAGVEQSNGRGLVTRINQGEKSGVGPGTPGSQNFALVFQDGGGNSVEGLSTTLIDQQGDGNTAFVDQFNSLFGMVVIDQDNLGGGATDTADLNQANVDQFDGTDLTVNIRQTFGVDPGGDNPNIANVTQTGSNNEVNVSQIDDDNLADILQDGHNNKIHTEQNDEAGGGANVLFANQDADTSDSSISILQEDVPNDASAFQFAASNSHIFIDQTDDNGAGAGNIATATQDSTTDSTIEIVQVMAGVGGDNVAVANQFGVTNALIEIEQVGAGNDAFAQQDTFAVPGDNLIIQISQVGAGHDADVFQSGNDNETVISQSGLGNTALVFQDGEEGWASIEQSGAANTASIFQAADSMFDDAFIVQAGLGNDATIVQSGIRGNNQLAVINQDGIGNNATVNQGMSMNP